MKKFDLNKCEICNRHFTKIHIHHKNGNHEDNHIINIIKSCSGCHSAIHQGINPNSKCRYRSYSETDVLEKIKELRRFWMKEKLGKSPKYPNDLTSAKMKSEYILPPFTYSNLMP